MKNIDVVFGRHLGLVDRLTERLCCEYDLTRTDTGTDTSNLGGGLELAVDKQSRQTVAAQWFYILE